jgi:predicted Rossmann fold flavoprotein
MPTNKYDVIVIGGGPAGMMTAGRAGELGAKVLLIEKNDRLGKKLSITGGRRCNITNAEFDNHIFLDNFPQSKQFLFSPFSKFNVESTFIFFERRGLPLIIEERKRAFPKSEKASDVCLLLKKYIEESGNVTVKLSTSLANIIIKNGKIAGVKTSNGNFHLDKLIIATGGLAAPETGSTGEGLSVLGQIGHSIKEPDPNLVPLKTSAKWVHSLSGTTIEDMSLSFIQNNKIKIKIRGRLLLTHFGISGPLVINSAQNVKNLLKTGKVKASLDLFPDLNLGELDKKFVHIFNENKNKQVKTILKELLQKKLAETILQIPEIKFGEIKAHSVTKKQRKLLITFLKSLHFPITGTMGFKWAIVADGGVLPTEVDFKNMTSRIYENLYLVGDILNINRPSGGFSLQLCWTTGWVAGEHSATQT